jgi:hypothetical protein
MPFFPGAVFSCHRLKTPARRVATLSEYNEVRNGLGTMPAPSTNDVLYSGIPTGLNIPALFKINLKISDTLKEKICHAIHGNG